MKHQKLARLFALALPLAGLVVSAQAQPGYDGRYNGDPYQDQPTYNTNQDRLRGTVARVYSPRNFDLRLANGDIVRVKTGYDLYPRVGDRVSASGNFKGRTLFADTVTNRSNRGGNNGYGYGNNNGYGYGYGYNNGNYRNGERVELRGEVVAVEGLRTLRVRSQDTGREFRVVSREDLNRRVSRGDDVVVRGLFDGSFVRADIGQIQLVSDDNRYNNGRYNDGFYNNGRYDNNRDDNGTYDNGSYGRSVSFPATVTVVHTRGIEVRGDNGQTYVVRASADDVNSLRAGDRVRVQGTTREGFIESTQLDRIR